MKLKLSAARNNTVAKRAFKADLGSASPKTKPKVTYEEVSMVRAQGPAWLCRPSLPFKVSEDVPTRARRNTINTTIHYFHYIYWELGYTVFQMNSKRNPKSTLLRRSQVIFTRSVVHFHSLAASY